MKDKITFLLLHLGFGGIETSTINIANALVDKYQIEIVSFYKLEKDQRDLLNKNIKIKYLYNGGPNRNEFHDAVHRHNPYKILKEGIKSVHILMLKKRLIVREIRKSDSKFIVSTRNDYSVYLSKYGKKNTVKIAQEHRHHNNDARYINNIRKYFNNIDYLFALTSSLKEDYEKFLINNKHTKIAIVPNMVYNPREKSNLNNKNVITISRLHPGKKVEELINIFSKTNIKDNKLYIVGDGEELDKLKNIVKEKGLSQRVLFTGYKTKEEMKKYILDSCVFAMTSISEGLPMVLLEAMGYGLPCIAYRTESGIADIIDNDVNGYIIDNRDEVEYINKLNNILSNKTKLNELSNNALNKVNEFSKDRIVDVWTTILDGE